MDVDRLDLATANAVLETLIRTGRALPAVQCVPWLRVRDQAAQSMAKLNQLL